jgi:hypothetical protein
MIKVTDNGIYVDGIKLGYYGKSYLKVIRSETKHTFWKYKAWSFNKELIDYAILKCKRNLVVKSIHKSGETAIYFIKADDIDKFVQKYDCIFDYKGELQYVIPKSFFDYKRENEMVYSPASNVAPNNMHTKSVSLTGKENNNRNSIYL